MPMNRALYAADWEKISRRIRHERAGNMCELCAAPNGRKIARSIENPARYIVLEDDQQHDRLAYHFPVKVVLTVAHMDHDPSNNDEANLRALCQRCHLAHDAQQHAENARKTRAAKKAEALREAGQESLL